jgi:hypothetical protein
MANQSAEPLSFTVVMWMSYDDVFCREDENFRAAFD